MVREKRFKSGQEGQAEGVTEKRNKLTRVALKGRGASMTCYDSGESSPARSLSPALPWGAVFNQGHYL